MRKITFAILISMAFSSCATIFGSTTSTFGVDTSPAGAHVKIFNRHEKLVYEGQTPATTTLNNGNGYFQKGIYRVEISMDGFQQKSVTVSSHLNGWYFGNLFIGGALGMLIIDPLTGGMYKLNEKYVNEKLAPVGGGASINTKQETLKLLTLNDVPVDLRSHLERIQ